MKSGDLTSEPLMPSQLAREYAEEAVGAASIVTNAGYYEIDIDAVALVFARFEAALKEAAPAMTREAAARLCLRAMFSLNYEGESLLEESEKVFSPNPKAVRAVELADAILALTTIAKQETDSVREAWQPISTAPKDGTRFLIVDAMGTSDIGFWHHDHACGDGYGAGPWTHWQPLPTPPAALSTDPTS